MTDTAFGRTFYRTAVLNLMRQFGETVTYYPIDGTQPREIQAMVERQPLESIAEIGSQVSEAIIVRVRNDQTTGIASNKVDTGGDEIQVATEVHSTPQKRSVVRVISDANGVLRLLCQ